MRKTQKSAILFLLDHKTKMSEQTAKHTPSTDLVPLTYDRKFYNIQNGTSLEHHDDQLTAVQAEAINEHFDLQVYLGAHGQGGGYDPNDEVFDFVSTAPTQAEYEAASRAVASMQPGDVLFTEGPGFRSQSIRIESDSHESEKLINDFLLLVLGVDKEGLKAAQLQHLEKQRQGYTISAWEYARQLANIKDIQVVYADSDAFDLEAADLSDEKIHNIIRGKDPEGWEKIRGQSDQRERKAINIVKDWALEHIDEPLPSSGRKPKLTLLFGAGHAEGLERRIAANRLDAEVHTMEMSASQHRVTEHIGHIASKTMGLLLNQLAAEMMGHVFGIQDEKRSRSENHSQNTSTPHSKRGKYGSEAKFNRNKREG